MTSSTFNSQPLNPEPGQPGGSADPHVPLKSASGQSAILRGFRLRTWLNLLRRVNYEIDKPYRRVAWMITLSSINFSRAARRELRNYAAQIVSVKVQPPIFILGHWRSGTTLLHTLLTQDPQFAFPNLLQVTQPHNFLTAEPYVEAALGRVQATRRAMDRMEVTYRSPGEEEGALAVMSLCSPMLGQMFPRQRDVFDRYLTFDGVPPDERHSWQNSLLTLAQKLSLRYPRRQLVFKSPQNTARIQMILEVFPQARFINIIRNPYHVFHSTQRLQAIVSAQSRLQDTVETNSHAEHENEWLINRYQTLYQAFFDQRDLIPDGHYTQLRFEDLELDMQTGSLEQLERIYTNLGLTGFTQAIPEFQAHIKSQQNYQKNDYSELPEIWRNRVQQVAKQIIQAGGYSK